VLLLNECLLSLISLSTQSGHFWIHHRTSVEHVSDNPNVVSHFVKNKGLYPFLLC